ncbi:rhodanese-like domain-containing protein [Natrononativus amylolyticus]|uniref:rhodanese-like domain-containing protein n=1 Tax=Natrononativus amylolyticus TaxID=2963434 RepID=UPI0020CBFB05|nr:rhodanese-like domain-containing protein [Natrononativus amylolyticus]
MNRRTLLAATGAAALGGLAGCLADEPESGDGYAADSDDVPEERSIDTSGYETMDFGGNDVPLAPIDDALYWYKRQEARMVDTRGEDQFNDSHITGAALSPAAKAVEGDFDDDPVADWDTSDRVVTYCDCPHQLAGIRASLLIDDGFEEVYAIDEGFVPWRENNYPTDGVNASMDLPAYTLHGVADAAHTGEFVWVSDTVADQHEIARIADDGSYEMTLRFSGLEDDSLLSLEAPDYALEATLADLTSGPITG